MKRLRGGGTGALMSGLAIMQIAAAGLIRPYLPFVKVKPDAEHA